MTSCMMLRRSSHFKSETNHEQLLVVQHAHLGQQPGVAVSRILLENGREVLKAEPS
jgi:hypothetical protein